MTTPDQLASVRYLGDESLIADPAGNCEELFKPAG